MTRKAKKTAKPRKQTAKKVCYYGTDHHYPAYIETRGKADSYDLVCGCGFSDLVATWYTKNETFGLVGDELQRLHVAFELLWAVQRAWISRNP